MEADARAIVSFLPVPRLKISPLNISDADGNRIVSNAIGRVELRILPLLLGRLEFGEITLVGATIALEQERIGRSAATPRELLDFVSAGARAHVARLVLRSCTFALTGSAGLPERRIDNVDLVVRRVGGSGVIDVAGSGRWLGEAFNLKLVGLDLAAIAGGSADGIELSAESRQGRVVAAGSLAWQDAPRFAGLLTVDTPSLDRLLRWTGLAPSLADFDRPLLLRGDALVTRGEVGWPQVRVQFGAERASGSLSVNLDRERVQVRATLAAEQIDAGWLGRRLLGQGNAWSTGDGPLADYDLRLSASSLRLGGLRLADAAASILIGRDRFELTLARAGLADGTVKARVSAQIAPSGRQDLRGQVSADRVDAGLLLAELGRPRLLAGRAVGQASFETAGEGPLALAQELRGRVSMSVRDGEFPGIAFTEDRRDEGSADARSGRTPFGRAYVNLNLANGSAEIADAAIEGGALRTTLEGRVSLADGTANLKATTQGASEAADDRRPPLVTEISGRLDRLLRPNPESTASAR